MIEVEDLLLQIDTLFGRQDPGHIVYERAAIAMLLQSDDGRADDVEVD